MLKRFISLFEKFYLFILLTFFYHFFFGEVKSETTKVNYFLFEFSCYGLRSKYAVCTFMFQRGKMLAFCIKYLLRFFFEFYSLQVCDTQSFPYSHYESFFAGRCLYRWQYFTQYHSKNTPPLGCEIRTRDYSIISLLLRCLR